MAPSSHSVRSNWSSWSGWFHRGCSCWCLGYWARIFWRYRLLLGIDRPGIKYSRKLWSDFSSGTRWWWLRNAGRARLFRNFGRCWRRVRSRCPNLKCLYRWGLTWDHGDEIDVIPCHFEGRIARQRKIVVDRCLQRAAIQRENYLKP